MAPLLSLRKVLSSLSGGGVYVECPACGTPIGVATDACPDCGVDLTVECRACGEAIEAATRECPNCGWTGYAVFLLE